jgi:hypothetical protein
VVPLYRNSRAWRVRALQYGFWLAAAGFLLGGLALRAWAPEADALALLILAPLIAAFALGMEVYRGLYVTALDAGPAGLSVRVLGFLGERGWVLPWDAVAPGQVAARRYLARGAVSSALLLRRPGGRLPLILDTTADPLDEAALRQARRRFSPGRAGSGR